MKQIRLTGLVFALFLMIGCNDESSRNVATPSSVTLLTKATTETKADTHRLLVFGDVPHDACLLNHTFSSGDVLTVPAGSYRFVTLTDADCFQLPAAGTVDGIRFDALLPLQSGIPLKEVLASQPSEIVYPGTTIYTATLKPATCLLQLTLSGAPDGLLFYLKNMSSGLSFSGIYPAGVPTAPYSVQPGVNICLPTGVDAVLEYQAPDGSIQAGTIDLGMVLEAGYIYSASLQWNEGGLYLKSEVGKWNEGDQTSGEAS
nr:hypothetical protein [Parabacteroides goldsteinii]